MDREREWNELRAPVFDQPNPKMQEKKNLLPFPPGFRYSGNLLNQTEGFCNGSHQSRSNLLSRQFEFVDSQQHFAYGVDGPNEAPMQIRACRGRGDPRPRSLSANFRRLPLRKSSVPESGFDSNSKPKPKTILRGMNSQKQDKKSVRFSDGAEEVEINNQGLDERSAVRRSDFLNSQKAIWPGKGRGKMMESVGQQLKALGYN